jgi:hypothetical protein
VGVPSPTGKRREPTGLHENENALFMDRIDPSPQVTEPVPATLPRWGSRVRIPSSAPGQGRFLRSGSLVGCHHCRASWQVPHYAETVG